jgi:PAS domain S-box-containing protein
LGVSHSHGIGRGHPDAGSKHAQGLLSRAGAVIAHSPDYETALSAIGTALVPALGDACVIDVLDGGVLRPVSAADDDGETASRIEDLYRRFPAVAGSPQPRGTVLRSGEPLLMADVSDEDFGAGALGEVYRRAVHGLGVRSAMFVPLVARDRTIGVVTLAKRRPAGPYSAGDLTRARELVQVIALATDAARMERDLRDTTKTRSERDNTLRLVFRRLPGTVWSVDRDLRFTYATGRLIDAAGIHASQVVGSHVSDFLGTRDPSDPGIARHLAALAGERQSFEYAYRNRWYTVLIDPLPAADGTVIGCVGTAFDITERRATEARLALNESRLGEAQRTAHVGSFEWDIRSNAVTWTEELHRIYGLPPGQFAGTFEAFLSKVHPDDLAHTQQVVRDACQEGGPFKYDHRVVRADGSVRTLHTRGEVINDPRGNATRLVGSCWDVTELAEATKARERLLSLLEATIEATADGTLVVDRDRKVVIHNRRFLSLWGIPADLADCHDEATLLAYARDQVEDPDEFIRGVEETYANPDMESIGQVRCLDGRVLERYSGPQRVGEAIVGRVWTFRDISEREQLLRSALFLSDATRLLASLEVEQALDAVARIAVPFMGDGCAIDVFGVGGPRRLIAISRDPRSPMSPELHPIVLGGHSLVYQVGSISYLGVPLVMMDNLVGAITLCAPAHRKYLPRDLEVAEELARRAALALDNARLFRRAQEALRARDEFLSVAAHEIRGPLTAIHLAAQTIRKGKARPESLPKLLGIVEREDRRLAQFVDELLDIGRIREGRLRFQFEAAVSLGQVVRDVATSLDTELIRCGSSLSVVTEENVVGKWDRFRLEQVVSNLLSNAIKFGLGRPIELTIRARDARAFLIVEDHGIGIEAEVLPRLFRPFERGVSQRNYGGLGLGLHIAKTIVEAMGGSMSVESEPGRGTVFTVELPAGGES